MLSSLGGDLALVIGLSIGRELLAASAEAQLTQVELVITLLVCNALLLKLPTWLALLRLWAGSPRGGGGGGAGGPDKGLIDFVDALLMLTRRLLLAALSQVLADTVSNAIPLRSVRVVSLLTTATFFVFMSSVLSVAKQ